MLKMIVNPDPCGLRILIDWSDHVLLLSRAKRIVWGACQNLCSHRIPLYIPNQVNVSRPPQASNRLAPAGQDERNSGFWIWACPNPRCERYHSRAGVRLRQSHHFGVWVKSTFHTSQWTDHRHTLVDEKLNFNGTHDTVRINSSFLECSQTRHTLHQSRLSGPLGSQGKGRPHY